MSRLFIDTNVIAYAFDRNEPEKRELALRLVQDIANRDVVVLSTQVLIETVSVLTRKFGMSGEQVNTVLAGLEHFHVVGADAAFVRSTIDKYREYEVSWWDALIIRAAQVARCDILLTEDLSHGLDFDGVVAENPFIDV